ncbi:MAG: RNA polymerase sigma factor [Clostridia bacterium]|nr:RNA polymerase sigma factor [Clostridia bacterium]
MNSFEKQLVDKLKNMDNEGFTLLFEHYYKKIYNLAFRMCGNKEDAEDIMQKTFVQAYTNISGFNGESSIYTWLYAITKNLCLRLLEKRKKSSFSSLDELLKVAQSIENPDSFTIFEKQYYISQVKEGCLLGLLRCLSFYQRIAFILNVLLEIKVKDVAVIISKTEPATRLLVHRAKQNIRSFLCKNCSLYDTRNPCHCENLIEFSLKQGWIKKMPDKSFISGSDKVIPAIESEINSLKKIALLYRSLEDKQYSDTMLQSIQKELHKHTYKIFYDKKVK